MDGAAEVQFDLTGCEFLDDVAGVGKRACEAVEFGDDERVARVACGERFAESGPGTVGTGQAVVDVDALGGDAECGEGVSLGSEVLALGWRRGRSRSSMRSRGQCAV